MELQQEYDPLTSNNQAPGKPNHKTKSRQLILVNKLRKKEDEWDQRFVLNHIPEYDPLIDRHCESIGIMLFGPC